MDNWNIYYDHFDPQSEGIREALCTLGNGYFALRGAAEEANADEIHYPGTYLAGGYNRLRSEIHGMEIENEDLVNFPNPLPIHFRIGESPWVKLQDVEILSFEQLLDLREGILQRKVRIQDSKGRVTRFSSRRLVSMDDPHVAAIEFCIHAENWEGDIEILSALDGRVENTGVKRYRQLKHKHLETIALGSIGEDSIYLQARTNQSHLHVALAARTKICINDSEPNGLIRGTYGEKEYIAKSYKLVAHRNEPVFVEKVITLYNSKDYAISECGQEACQAVERQKNL